MIELPEGWTHEQLPYPQYTAIYMPVSLGGGIATIDYHERVVRDGLCTTGRPALAGRYTGRGWRQQLERDAVDRLQRIFGLGLRDAREGMSDPV